MNVQTERRWPIAGRVWPLSPGLRAGGLQVMANAASGWTSGLPISSWLPLCQLCVSPIRILACLLACTIYRDFSPASASTPFLLSPSPITATALLHLSRHTSTAFISAFQPFACRPDPPSRPRESPSRHAKSKDSLSPRVHVRAIVNSPRTATYLAHRVCHYRLLSNA